MATCKLYNEELGYYSPLSNFSPSFQVNISSFKSMSLSGSKYFNAILLGKVFYIEIEPLLRTVFPLSFPLYAISSRVASNHTIISGFKCALKVSICHFGRLALCNKDPRSFACGKLSAPLIRHMIELRHHLEHL